jgi:hypothetical protein
MLKFLKLPVECAHREHPVLPAILHSSCFGGELSLQLYVLYSLGSFTVHFTILQKDLYTTAEDPALL